MKKSSLNLLLAGTMLVSLAACSHDKSISMSTAMLPAADAHIDGDMAAVLNAQASLHPKPIETLSADEARLQPSAADGAKKVLAKMGMNPNDSMNVGIHDLDIAGADGMIPARIYMPDFTNLSKPLPVIVYYHGGGFVIADINTYDSTPRAMAKAAGAMVISVEYRKAPEHKFPAAHNDAFAAYKWTVNNVARFGGDPKKIALLGESAGGNLAIDTAIKARDTKGLVKPVYEALIYPVAGVDMNTPSYMQNANAKPLSKGMMAWFMQNEMASPNNKMDPRLDVVGRANLRGLPPTTIVTAQVDPLQSEGQALADKLGRAGVPTRLRNYDGVTHEFFGMGAGVAKAKMAESNVASDLESAFGNAPTNAVQVNHNTAVIPAPTPVKTKLMTKK